MKVNEVLKLFQNFEEECNNGFFFKAFAGDSIKLYEVGNFPIIYEVKKDGKVLRYDYLNKDSYIEELTINDIRELDLEMFSDSVCFRSGYYKVSSMHQREKIDMIMQNLYYHLLKLSDEGKIKTMLTPITGNEHKRFSYVSNSGITVNIQNIGSLCRRNTVRRHYGAKCFPFIRNLQSDEAIHISLSVPTKDFYRTDIITNADYVISEAASFLREIDTTSIYIECRTKLPVYI